MTQRLRDRWFAFRLLALGCCIATATAAVIVLQRGSTRPIIGNQSFATLTAFVSGSLLAVCSLWAAFQPTARWQSAIQFWRDALTMKFPPQGNARHFYVLTATALLAHLALAVNFWTWNQKPVDDQWDYLQKAELAAERWGVAGLPAALLNGEFREDNRNPLYVALLALHPLFAWGKLLSAFFALAVTATAALIAREQFGPLVGGGVATVLSVNFALHHSGASVACESLLTLLVLLGWRSAALARSSSYSAVLSGLFFGLAYLAKASAFMLFAWIWLWNARGVYHSPNSTIKWSALSAATFLIAVFPLLVRNVRVYGNPLHNYNTRMLFADSFEEGRDLRDEGFSHNFRRYLQTHSLNEISERYVYGGVREGFIITRSLGPVPWDSSRVFFGLFLAIGAIIGLLAAHWANEKPIDGGLIGGLIIFWQFFGWYTPIAASDRFILPLVPCLTIYAVFGITQICRARFGEKTELLLFRLFFGYILVSAAAAFIQDYSAFFPTL